MICLDTFCFYIDRAAFEYYLLKAFVELHVCHSHVYFTYIHTHSYILNLNISSIILECSSTCLGLIFLVVKCFYAEIIVNLISCQIGTQDKEIRKKVSFVITGKLTFPCILSFITNMHAVQQ